MDLSKVPGHIILQQLDHMIQNERKQMHLILLHLNEVETRRLYELVKCKSLFEYLRKHQGYSETSSLERMNAARLLRKAPEISEKLQSGSVNMSQLAKIEAGLKAEEKQRKKEKSNKGEQSECTDLQEIAVDKNVLNRDLPQVDKKSFILDLVNQVQNKTLYETQGILAEELNIPIKKSQKKIQQKDKSIRLELTLNEEQVEIFQRAQSLMSHVVKDGDLSDAIAYLSKIFVQQKLGKTYFQVKDQTSMQSLTEAVETCVSENV